MFDRATLSLGTTSVTSNVALQAGSSQQGIARLASVDYKTCTVYNHPVLCHNGGTNSQGGKYTCEFQLVLVQFQYNWLYIKLPFTILWPNSISILFRSDYWIIENPVLKIFSLFAEFFIKISTQMAQPYIETLILKISKHWDWKSNLRNSSYLKFHIEPALVYAKLDNSKLKDMREYIDIQAVRSYIKHIKLFFLPFLSVII